MARSRDSIPLVILNLSSAFPSHNRRELIIYRNICVSNHILVWGNFALIIRFPHSDSPALETRPGLAMPVRSNPSSRPMKLFQITLGSVVWLVTSKNCYPVAQSTLQRTVGLLVLYEMPFAHKKHVGLYLNVVRPVSVSEGADLPVIVVSRLSVIVEDNKISLSSERSGYTAVIFQNRH